MIRFTTVRAVSCAMWLVLITMVALGICELNWCLG
jgi:hypothetical protein